MFHPSFKSMRRLGDISRQVKKPGTRTKPFRSRFAPRACGGSGPILARLHTDLFYSHPISSVFRE
jgi:hypothetical protein